MGSPVRLNATAPTWPLVSVGKDAFIKGLEIEKLWTIGIAEKLAGQETNFILVVARFHFANLDFTNVHRILKFNL